jgi:hypothetical protein
MWVGRSTVFDLGWSSWFNSTGTIFIGALRSDSRCLSCSEISGPITNAAKKSMGFLSLVFGALQILHFIPPDLPSHAILRDSFTNVRRRTTLFSLDVYALYFSVYHRATASEK